MVKVLISPETATTQHLAVFFIDREEGGPLETNTNNNINREYVMIEMNDRYIP